MLICSTAEARDFYFSSDGDDSNACTQNNPCNSHRIANKEFYLGDHFYFDRGDTWEENQLGADATEDEPTYIVNNIFYTQDRTDNQIELIGDSDETVTFTSSVSDGNNGDYLVTDGQGVAYWKSKEDKPAESEPINQTEEWKRYWARLYEK